MNEAAVYDEIGRGCADRRRPDPRIAAINEAYLDPDARRAISSFSRIDARAGLARLGTDLETGAWSARNAELLDLSEADFGYRLIRCELAGA